MISTVMEVEFGVGVWRGIFLSVTKCERTRRPVFKTLTRFYTGLFHMRPLVFIEDTLKLDRLLLQTWEQNSCVFHLDLSIPYHLLCVSPKLIPALSRKDRSVDFFFFIL